MKKSQSTQNVLMRIKNFINIFVISLLILASGASFYCKGAVTTYEVSTAFELMQAIKNVNQLEGNEPAEIILFDGSYTGATNMRIMRPNITLRSKSKNPNKVILSGTGMRQSSDIEVIFDISASNVTISGITLKSVSHHLIQVRAERDADFFTLKDCILQDSYQQLLKVSGGNRHFADFGLVQNNRFEYTAGVGPNYYIGGIDAHHSRGWIVEKNTFKNIASPAERVAEHAIHFWHKSFENTVINNVIINSDRGIGFGMGDNKNQAKGGIIANNFILHNNDNHKFADVGIVIESSPFTKISQNNIQANSSYPNAIEYRYLNTQNVLIEGNITNKAIVARNGASATLVGNTTSNTLEQYWKYLRYFYEKSTRSLF